MSRRPAMCWSYRCQLTLVAMFNHETLSLPKARRDGPLLRRLRRAIEYLTRRVTRARVRRPAAAADPPHERRQGRWEIPGRAAGPGPG